MKYLLFDANNIASLSFYRARSIMTEEIQKKLNAENEKELYDEMKKNITGFAIHLFFNKVHTIMKEFNDRRVLFVWDGRYGSAWRKKANSDYKANRNHDDDNLYFTFINMMNTTSDILRNYPVLQFTKENAEADDLIYSIVKTINGEDIVVVSTDSDMIQLPQQFKNINIWNPITKKLHVIPDYNYVLFKSVVGDVSDNISGVPRYGKAKGQKVAKEGIHILSEENVKIVEKNIQIIDMSKNPYESENTEFVKSIFASSEIKYDLEQIKKCFFDFKLKQQLDQFSSTTKLIKSLP